MKLILLTSPNFFIEEDKILTTLFEEGLDQLHLRKPDSEPVYCERLLSLIPSEYHSRIITYEHFYLRDEFDLMGIHLSNDTITPPTDYHGNITRTAYTLEQIKEYKQNSLYVCMDCVYPSVSEPNQKQLYTLDEMRDAVRQGVIDRKVMALGGVKLENLQEIKELGFGGAVVRGDLWNRFDIHSGFDYKMLISHFRNMRRVAG
ncbi:MAG: thiamine phosphate synthase [Bacteroidaceae bacterium]|nr:thiamine phosphate synthase [Bacteroidaceae bacterium]MBR2945439.1 thiamine phosphate synthase [Bacteroidaceae bacterium]MDO5489848.1 thiamine phosphate synthase [Bacteroidaceae bacterium]